MDKFYKINVAAETTWSNLIKKRSQIRSRQIEIATKEETEKKVSSSLGQPVTQRNKKQK